MLATYHTHTIWSDGQTALANLIRAAERSGVDELGVSDHFTLDPSGRSYDWSLQPNQLPYYVEEVMLYRQRSSVPLRLGLEVDWFSGQGEVIASALAGVPFDYLLGAVHLVEGKQFGNDPAWWQAMPEHELARRHTLYWTLIAEMARSRLFDIVAHIDLPKIHGILPISDLRPAISEALDAIAAAGMVVELNTAGWLRPCADAYPSLEILGDGALRIDLCVFVPLRFNSLRSGFHHRGTEAQRPHRVGIGGFLAM